MNYPRLFLTIALLSTIMILLPKNANAQIDPRCWTKEDCIEVRRGFAIGNDQRAEDGFVQNAESEAACGGKEDSLKQSVGFCLPATKTVTEISFGGKREFANIGEFIQLIYRYAIIIAGILATIVIILAGIRWTASGGNAERIKSAQKMIGGAISGLVIALLSYSILNALNPATVNLRLPQVWLIRPQGLGGIYCSQQGDAPLAKKERVNRTPAQAITSPAAAGSTSEFTASKATAECGYRFLIQGKNNQTCIGDVCPGLRNVCTPGAQFWQCKTGAIAGTISAVQGFFSGTDLNERERKIIDGPIKLLALCKDGTILKTMDNSEIQASGQTAYFIEGPIQIKTVCDKNNKGLAGFFLGAEVNDEGSGLLRPGDPLTTGVDDWHAIGQREKGSHECRTNLAKKAYFIKTKQSPSCQGNECSCAYISQKNFAQELAGNKDFTKHLLTEEELTKGYVCDITISRSEFPAVNNAGFDTVDALLQFIPGPQQIYYSIKNSVNALQGDGKHTNCDLFQ